MISSFLNWLRTSYRFKENYLVIRKFPLGIFLPVEVDLRNADFDRAGSDLLGSVKIIRQGSEPVICSGLWSSEKFRNKLEKAKNSTSFTNDSIATISSDFYSSYVFISKGVEYFATEKDDFNELSGLDKSGNLISVFDAYKQEKELDRYVLNEKDYKLNDIKFNGEKDSDIGSSKHLDSFLYAENTEDYIKKYAIRYKIPVSFEKMSSALKSPIIYATKNNAINRRNATLIKVGSTEVIASYIEEKEYRRSYEPYTIVRVESDASFVVCFGAESRFHYIYNSPVLAHISLRKVSKSVTELCIEAKVIMGEGKADKIFSSIIEKIAGSYFREKIGKYENLMFDKMRIIAFRAFSHALKVK